MDDIIARVTSVQFKPPIDKRRHHSGVMSNRLPQLVIGQIYALQGFLNARYVLGPRANDCEREQLKTA